MAAFHRIFFRAYWEKCTNISGSEICVERKIKHNHALLQLNFFKRCWGVRKTATGNAEAEGTSYVSLFLNIFLPLLVRLYVINPY
jgi:hypothetical protein